MTFYEKRHKPMEVIGFLFIILLFILLAILGPLVTIWALNTLFPVLAIPYNFWSWCAVIILHLSLKTNLGFKSK